MKYLTRVPQHELRMRTGNRADSPDNRHRDVMSLFGELGVQPRKEAGILFRLEHLPDSAPAYLIRSSVKPENLTPSAQIKEEDDATFIPIDTLVSFRLSVNAIQRLKSGGIRPVLSDFTSESDDSADDDDWDDLANSQPKTFELTQQTGLTEWLQERLSPALSEVSILNHQREVVGANRNRSKNTPNTKVIQVDLIDGVARISDSAALKTLLSEGVGRARSYGCGLLTVNPLP